NHLQSARTYLEKVCHVEFPGTSRAWDEFQTFAQIRNLLVHEGGIVTHSGRGKGVVEYLRGREDLSLEKFAGGGGEVQVTKAFCQQVIARATPFFNDLYGAVYRPLAAGL